MKVGIIMLAHTALDRAAQVAAHWAKSGCPMVIHVDSRTDIDDFKWMKAKLREHSGIRFLKREKCEWGGWSIVSVTQIAATQLLDQDPDITHVLLASGSCLPLRPVSELETFLAEHPKTDFIESVTTDDVDWTVGGLDQERFTLRFPLSWKRQRRLFDGYVRLQRRVNFKRKIPDDIVPHMGSQWWCLTRQTLSAILQSDRRPVHDRYFKRVWIPDESYFQTLARLYSLKIESRSLTLFKFDFQGKPHVFYDDHLPLLKRSDCFVARKAWPKAEKLYREFLGSDDKPVKMAEPNPLRIDRLFSRATARRTRGRPGLYMQSRYPVDGWENGKSAGAYSVFVGLDDLVEEFDMWLEVRTGNPTHGRLFDPDRVRFRGNASMFRGSISDNAELRNYDPSSFLRNLLWNGRGDHIAFQFSAADEQEIVPFLASDSNANVSIVTGAWMIPLFHSNLDFAEIRQKAARLQRSEIKMLETFRAGQAKARVKVWNLAEFLEEPMQNLQFILDRLNSAGGHRIKEVPKLADLSDFGKFLQTLKNQGMSPANMGDFTVGEMEARTPVPQRPYVVK